MDSKFIDQMDEPTAGAALKFLDKGIDSLSEEEAGLLLPHIDKFKGVGKKKAGFFESVAPSFMEGANRAADALSFAQAGTARMFGAEPETLDKIFQAMEDRNKYWKDYTSMKGKERGFASKLAGIPGNIPFFLGTPGLAAVGAGTQPAKSIIEEGGSVPAALKAGGAETALTSAFLAAPAAIGTGALTKGLVGAGANVGQQELSHGIQNTIREGEGLQELPPIGWDDRAVAGLGGFAFGSLAKDIPLSSFKRKSKASSEYEKTAPPAKPVEDTGLDIPPKTGELSDIPVTKKEAKAIDKGRKTEFSPVFENMPIEERLARTTELGATPVPKPMEGMPAVDFEGKKSTEALPLERKIYANEWEDPNLPASAWGQKDPTAIRAEIEQAYIEKAKQDNKVPTDFDFMNIKEPSQSGGEKSPQKQLPFNFKKQGGGINLFDKKKLKGITDIFQKKTELWDNLIKDQEVILMDVKDRYKNITDPQEKAFNDSQIKEMEKYLSDLKTERENVIKTGVPVPENRKPLPETGRILPMKSPGNKQGGGWTPFASSNKPQSWDSFIEDIKNDLPEGEQIDVNRARKAYDNYINNFGKTKAEVPETTRQANAMSKISSRISDKYTGDIPPWEEAVTSFKDIPDFKDNTKNFLRRVLSSGGNIGRDLLDHPLVTRMSNIVTKNKQDAEVQARHALDDAITGVMPIISKNLWIHGWKGNSEVIQKMLMSEGKGATHEFQYPQQQKLYEAITNAKGKLYNAFNEIVQQRGGKPLKNISDHWVHYWAGPYKFEVNVKDSKGNWRRVYGIGEKSPAMAAKARKWVQDNFAKDYAPKDIEITPTRFDSFSMRHPSRMFDYLLEQNLNDDPVILQAMDKYQKAVMDAQNRHLGEQHRLDPRKGVKGYMGFKPWNTEFQNYKESIETLRRTFDAGWDWIAAQKTAMEFKKIEDAQKNKEIDLPNAVTVGKSIRDNAFGYNVDEALLTKALDAVEKSTPEFNYVRRGFSGIKNTLDTLAIPFLLAFKPGQIAQSVLQPFQAVVPKMMEHAAAFNNGVVDIAKADLQIPGAFAHGFLDGITYVTDSAMKNAPEFSIHRSSWYRNIVSDLTKQIDDYADSHDISRMSLVDTKSLFGEGGRVREAGNMAWDALGNAPLRITESPVRMWAFSAYTRHLVDMGMPVEQALKIAHTAMDSMVNYEPWARPQIAGNAGFLGKEGTRLHNFMINWYSQLDRYIKMALEDPKYATPALTYLATSLALAGAVGFVGVDFVDWGWDNIKSAIRGTKFDDPDWQKFTFRQWMMDNFPEEVSVGLLSKATDMAIYGSFSSKVVDPSRSFIENLFPVSAYQLDVVGSLLTKGPKVLTGNASESTEGLFLRDVMPKAFTGSIDQKYFTEDNKVLSKTGKREPVYKRTDEQQEQAKGLRGTGLLGTRTIKEAKETESWYADKKADMNVNESKNKQLEKFDEMISNYHYGDPNTTEKDIAAFVTQLATKWNYDPKLVEKRWIRLYESLAKENLLQRRLPKTINLGNIESTKSILERMKENKANK